MLFLAEKGVFIIIFFVRLILSAFVMIRGGETIERFATMQSRALRVTAVAYSRPIKPQIQFVVFRLECLPFPSSDEFNRTVCHVHRDSRVEYSLCEKLSSVSHDKRNIAESDCRLTAAPVTYAREKPQRLETFITCIQSWENNHVRIMLEKNYKNNREKYLKVYYKMGLLSLM